MRFSKLFETYQDWLREYLTRPTTRYGIRIWSYMQTHPEATLAEARGHKPEVPPIYRVSYGMKAVPVHHEYYGFLLQAWSDDPDYLSELDRQLEDLFVKLTAKWLGYKESEWWFKNEIGYERPQEMFLKDVSLINTWEWRVEKKGMILDLEKGVLSGV